MKTGTRCLLCVGAVTGVLSVGASPALAYEVETHRAITEAGYDRTTIANGSLFAQLGIAEAPASKLFPGSSGISRSARDLMGDGAVFEDNAFPVPRPVNHFFNPLTGLGIFGNLPAPDWALADRQIPLLQGYAYLDARQAYYDALTKPAAADRDTALGATFETLGHVVHVIQDMAQPQHVRNDSHFFLGPNRSRYELFTDQVLQSLPRDGYRNTYASNDPQSLTSPRSFWQTGAVGESGVRIGKGLAEFTNRNFVSAGTNFRGTIDHLLPSSGLNGTFPLPDPTLAVVGDPIDASSLDATLPAGYFMRFIGTPISETLFTDYPQASNTRTSTFSLFDQDLKLKGADYVFALNKFNFLAAHTFLIPRAVAYSAGMVDYFFRGDVNLAIDQAHMGKYVLQNFSTEPMSGKFEFYYDALDDTRKPVPDATWSNLSIPAKDAQGNPGTSAGIRLNSPSDAKTSGKYMLVFSGDMGDEKKGDGNSDHSYGAVVGRMVTAAPLEGLYIVGSDSQGQKLSFRVDETGTHLLTGKDPQGVMHYAAFDPIVNASNVDKKAFYVKQARFLVDGYRIQAVSSPGGGFIRDPVTQEIVTAQHLSWVAQSNDPSVGWFSFALAASGPNSGWLSYIRTYTDAQGHTQTASGYLPLPPLPHYDSTLEPTHPSVNYQDFVKSKLVLSSDGQHIYGLMTWTGTLIGGGVNYIQTETRHQISLNIALGTTPSLTASEDAALVRVTTAAVQTTDGATEQLDLTACSCGYLTTAFSHVSLRTEVISGTDRQWVGVFNNALSSFDITEDSPYHEQQSEDYVATVAGGGDCDYIVTSIYSWTTDYASRSAVTYNLTDGQVTSFSNDVRPVVTRHTIPNPSCRSAVNGAPPTTGGVCSGGPLDPLDLDCGLRLEPLPPPVHTSDIKHLELVMTASSAGIVFSTPNFNYIFRGIDLGSKPFVGDASPLGEIFFATTDMSTIIHEPANGRMPVFVPPSNLINILGALWI